MILLASMKAEMKSRWPEEPLATGKHTLRRCKRNSDVYVTLSGRRVRCKVYAMKWSSRAGAYFAGVSIVWLIREEVRDEPGGQARHLLTAVKGIAADLWTVRTNFIC